MYITIIIFSETAWIIKAKFRMEPSWKVRKKVYINGTGHITKMAAMLIYGKSLQNSSAELSLMVMKLCMEQYVLKLYKVYINDDPELTLAHYKSISNLAKLFFCI